ncbi:hypothetical protein D021_1728B, partial [Vibrio parahaemolyticus 10296]
PRGALFDIWKGSERHHRPQSPASMSQQRISRG